MHFIKHEHGNGVHERFWKAFCQFLNFRAQRAVDSGEVDMGNFVVGATEVIDAISGKNKTSGNWLSSMRNEINYLNRQSVWFPIEKKIKASGYLDEEKETSSSSISLQIDQYEKPIEAFVNICKFLALLNFEISNSLAKRSSGGNTFGQKWKRLINSF